MSSDSGRWPVRPRGTSLCVSDLPLIPRRVCHSAPAWPASCLFLRSPLAPGAFALNCSRCRKLPVSRSLQGMQLRRDHHREASPARRRPRPPRTPTLALHRPPRPPLPAPSLDACCWRTNIALACVFYVCVIGTYPETVHLRRLSVAGFCPPPGPR